MMDNFVGVLTWVYMLLYIRLMGIYVLSVARIRVLHFYFSTNMYSYSCMSVM